jgi:ABC-type phosphate/phosphonate transport system permease subunit
VWTTWSGARLRSGGGARSARRRPCHRDHRRRHSLKTFAEAIENVDRKQIDGVQATDASPVQTMRFGIIPQVLPIMISNALYMFESNSRSATILGIVGAGGIGFHLSDRIRAHR